MASPAQNTSKRTPFPKWLLVVAIIVLLTMLILPRLKFSALFDYFRTLGFTPTPEVAAIEDSLALTDSARTIFRATHPELDSNNAFNDHCNSRNADISVLGCYTGGDIHIYNITDTDLSGVRESTAAHELLHAAWDRLSTSEKQTIAAELDAVYQADPSKFDDELKLYNDSERIDELHARIGTQLADLPETLETYYARYFQNQDAVVAYYQNYITPFRELSTQLETLSSELDGLKTEIDTKTAEYVNRNNILSSRIIDFNHCANTPGCFTVATFNAQRAQLIAEQTALNSLYQEIDANVNAYNEKVQAYNENILRSQTLQDSINSNSLPANL